ncbi:MAG: ABC transporter substrate-binding protein, partial [Planctomycetota bacterium]|nr:ABC transporter substrate-binding protein [Planctomycetota bacterium]
VAALAFLLLGSGGQGRSTPDALRDKPAVAPGAGSWDGPKVFRLPLSENPPSLDPIKIQDVTSDGVARKIFNGLVRADTSMKPAPDLAEAVPEWNAAEKSYTFKLRQGVKFHNGREVKAADVKYSWERLLDPNVSERVQILEPVVGAKDKINRKAGDTTGIEVLDDYTIRVTLTDPSPTFLLEIGMINASIIPREAVEAAEQAGGTFSRQPVGTGPFKLVEWRENSRIELARHDEYFKGKPRLDGVVYEVIPDPQTRLDHFARGAFEVCDIPFGRLKGIQQEHPEWVSRNPAFRTYYLGMAMHHPAGPGGKNVPTEPLGINPKLRQAINHALNRQYICDTILEKRGQPAYCILPPGMMAHDPELKGWTYDPAKAKALLAEAGYPNGAGLRPLTLLYSNNPDVKKVVLAIHSDLTAIGITVNLQALDWGAFLDRVGKDPPDMFYLQWVADYNDPDNFLYYLFHTRQFGSPGNETRYSKPEVDTLLDQARATIDNDERVKLYRRAERIIVADCPWALIEHRVNYILMQPYVRGAREQLTCLDIGSGLNQVDFSTVDFAK